MSFIGSLCVFKVGFLVNNDRKMVIWQDGLLSLMTFFM